MVLSIFPALETRKGQRNISELPRGRWEAGVRSQVSGSESKISHFPNRYLTGTTISLPSAFENILKTCCTLNTHLLSSFFAVEHQVWEKKSS